jgi:tRNA (guanine26-N2/guanine27-N2)-dimethyltransferase
LNEGLRAIRYWKEIPGVKRIVANDLSESAVEAIKRNVDFNDIPDTCVVPNKADAM